MFGKLWMAVAQPIYHQFLKVGGVLKTSWSLVFKTHLTFGFWANPPWVMVTKRQTSLKWSSCHPNWRSTLGSQGPFWLEMDCQASESGPSYITEANLLTKPKIFLRFAQIYNIFHRFYNVSAIFCHFMDRNWIFGLLIRLNGSKGRGDWRLEVGLK